MRGRWGAFAVVALLVAGCTGGSEPEAAPPTASPTPTPDPTCPITGLDVPAGVDVERPAVAVKIENSPQARPQSGLAEADIVFEEIVEGGITRFMAIYHCGEAQKAGPVRSARFDDPGIAKPFTRVLAYSGSNAIVDRELRRRKIVVVNEQNSGAFFRDPPGVFEVHNLFVDTEKVRKQIPKAARKPPPEMFTFGETAGNFDRARRVDIDFSASNDITYRYRAGEWRRFEGGSPFTVQPGGQIAIPNVLVLQVTVNPSPKIVDVAGNPSPDIELFGTGRALLFRDGVVVKGTWTRGEGKAWSFARRNGEGFTFAEGPTWVELVPDRRGGVKGKVDFR